MRFLQCEKRGKKNFLLFLQKFLKETIDKGKKRLYNISSHKARVLIYCFFDGINIKKFLEDI